jgi:hypothetical protein
MKIYIIFCSYFSDTVRAGLEEGLRLAEFIADIYRQFPRGCIFILNYEAQQQSENEFYIN